MSPRAYADRARARRVGPRYRVVTDAMRAAETYGRLMSVRVRILPETEPQRPRPHPRRGQATIVATTLIAAAAIAIAAADDPAPGDARLTGPAPAGQPCDSWRFNDPRVQKGARGAPIG
jgi:hypothetical protein